MKTAAVIISIVMSVFGFAGGGGSSSDSGGSSSSSSSYDSGSSSSSSKCEGPECVLETIFGFSAFAIFIAVAVYVFRSYNKAELKRREDANKTNNSTTQEKQIRQAAEFIFKSYQDDWGNFAISNIAGYTTPRYYQHAVLMLGLLKSLNRVNKVNMLKVESICLKQPVNDATQLPAKISVEFEFSGLDEVIDTKTGETLYSYMATNVTETWSFIYDGATLKLDGISQPTESSSHLVKNLAEFSNKHSLFYSPDWGRYALPSRGLIFTKASMISSDVNNHIVGKWGDLLIQLYTYSEVPSNPKTYFIVGQISLPKSYLGVIVKSKHQRLKAMKHLDKSYDQFELEWPDFNERYEVYAAKADALPAFELLNPKFMEYLYSKNPNFSMEVIDNTIYIFANVKTIAEQDYSDLLDVLAAAYKELKQ